MLDEFSLEQPMIYNILLNSILKNKVSHAYLIETNGYSKSFDFILAISKFLLCPNNYINNAKCGKCNQCSNINKNEFLELKIIEAEGQWIKKNQLEELQSEFSKKSIIGTKRVYIIKDAEKLNPASSNSLLKFLEEPEEGIIAILMVENKNKLLDTIISRCQILKLKPNIKNNLGNTLENLGNTLFKTKNEIEEYINNIESKPKLEKIIEFIKYYEDNKINTIIYLNKLWHNNFKEKTEIFMSMSIMILFYKDVLNYKLENNLEIFTEYDEIIKYISKKNEIDVIISKINVIMNLQEKIKFNANNNLLMDKLIIDLEGCENDD